uniref:Uncharacterized protein n=1 Tax=Romanomermis culicivorax TaxID=13658 RepID=A0A915LAH3_ROMCU
MSGKQPLIPSTLMFAVIVLPLILAHSIPTINRSKRSLSSYLPNSYENDFFMSFRPYRGRLPRLPPQFLFKRRIGTTYDDLPASAAAVAENFGDQIFDREDRDYKDMIFGKRASNDYVLTPFG